MKKVDFLSVGDITIDSFIRIKDVGVHCELNRERCQFCLNFGEKVPFESVEDIFAAGNASNAAVSISRLGLSSAVVTDIGDGEAGKACLRQLEKEKVSTEFVTAHNGLPTNRHFVLWYEDERSILVHHTPYPYKLPKLPDCSWMYLTSIGTDSGNYHSEINEYLDAHPNTKLMLQPGTFQIKMGAERLAPFYKRAEVISINAAEASRIVGATLTISNYIGELHNLGPKIVIVTDGRNGTHLSDGTNHWVLPIYPDPRPPVERTGAGDATASTFVSYLSLGFEPIEALKRGHINARSVVQEVGAQRGLLTREKIEEALKNAPPEFTPQKIS